MTFGNPPATSTGRSPSAGGGHARQHQPCGSSNAPKRCSSEEAIDDPLRIARCLLAGKAGAAGRAIARSFWGDGGATVR